MHQLYVLFEHATGYGLFRTTQFEEIGIFNTEVQKSMTDVSKFRSIVFLVAFQPFKTIKESVENMKCLSEGQLHLDLQLFLEDNVPKSKKSKQAVVLGVQDPKLAACITEKIGISCNTSGVVSEVIRGIRFHLHKLIKGYKDRPTIIQTQLALGHHIARANMYLNSQKFDKTITETIDTIDQLEKDLNVLYMKIKHLFSLHFPELATIVPDRESYIKSVKEIKNIKNISDDTTSALNSILNDSGKVQDIIQAAQMSMGMDISDVDSENIEEFVSRIISMMKRRDEMNDYVNQKMCQVAPNLTALVGVKVGAQLIAKAGSLINLAKLTASTVQVLGAEKALFRALKTKGNATSNFNSISHSGILGKSKILKGRLARIFAHKCSLAARMDCFSPNPIASGGEKLKQEVESKLKFYETGKFGVCQAPVKTEEQKAAQALKKTERRRRKKERRRKKLTVLKETNSGKAESPASDVEIFDESSTEKTGTKRKSLVLDEENVDNEETMNITENGVVEQVKMKRKRKSLRKLKS